MWIAFVVVALLVFRTVLRFSPDPTDKAPPPDPISAPSMPPFQTPKELEGIQRSEASPQGKSIEKFRPVEELAKGYHSSPSSLAP